MSEDKQVAGTPLAAKRDAGVRLAAVTYEYQAKEAVASTIPVGKISDISLRVNPGEVALLCGASGSGKSTVLRTINALAPQFHGGELTGSITVAGHDMHKVELHDVCALSATVFQNPRTQFFTTDVRSEMAFPLENLARDPELIRTRIADIAKRSGITWALERTLASLSGGQLQRVACACAMVMDVPVILFDEPTSNLDTEAIIEFSGMLQLLKDAGAAIVVAEHRLHFLQGIADRVYRLEAGVIVEEFAADDFFALSSAKRRERGLRSLHPAHPELPAPRGAG
ncbi:MAG: ABC transporter ATP-binding protein, partial [Bowdeniella nasicola]|nr:ABC transporter ATP-binding protein [Bowdeniella nasicola]